MLLYIGEMARVEIPKIPAHFTGTGDLFSALLLAWGHEGLQVCTWTQSKGMAMDDVYVKPHPHPETTIDQCSSSFVILLLEQPGSALALAEPATL